MTKKLLSTTCLLWSFLCGLELSAQNGPKNKHVLVISIDGMHLQDLAKWVQANPNSALARTVGIFTGASPALGGMYHDDSWNRGWVTAGSTCGTRGSVIDLKDGIDATPVAPPANATLNPDNRPLDPDNGCQPVFPHNMMRVNTVFKVVQAGMYTAYSEKRPSYDFLNGPSGSGVQDLYTPEIAAVNLLNLSQMRGSIRLTN